MNKKTYKIYTLGCKVNQCDSRELGGLLQERGFVKAGKEKADVAVINTCCVTKSAIRKDKKAIQKAKKENPHANIVVMGCWPSVYGEDCIEADLVRNTGKLSELASEIFESCAITNSLEKGQSSTFCVNEKKVQTKNQDVTLERCRYTLKIQDGCEQFCSYCVIPFARGKYNSRPEKDILEEARRAIGQGYKEIVLCGIHLGKYQGRRQKAECGRRNTPDESNPETLNLEELLVKMVRLNGLGRIRLSSIEMNEVSDSLIGLIRDSGKICKHLHIPLQSGSDKILKQMNRPYSRGEFLERIMSIKALIPDISITTDIIVGFPGEDDNDFRQTCDLAQKAGFSRIHVFSFSGHEKTPAYDFPNKVDALTIAKRADELKRIGLKLERKYRNYFKGQKMEIVVENQRGDKIIGKTEYYFDIVVSADKITGNCAKSPKDMFEVLA